MSGISQAVIMAAGEGRRLRPITELWPKPVLPIDGRPVIASLLHELREAAIERVTIVTGHLAEQVETLVGRGEGFELDVRYARQLRADGSADAVSTALRAGARPPFLISAADTLYSRGDLARFATAFAAAEGSAGALALRRGIEPSSHKPGVVVDAGRVRRIHALDSSLPLTAAPLWGFGPELERFLAGLPGPPFELKDAYQRAIDDGLEVAAVELGATRDLTFPLDLVQENFPYLKRV